MSARALHIFGDIIVISIIIIVFCTSCFYLIKRCRKDRAFIRDLTSNNTIVPAQLVEQEIVVAEVSTLPQAPEIPDN